MEEVKTEISESPTGDIETQAVETEIIPEDAPHKEFHAKPYWNPYIAGIGLGLVLLLSFVIMGRGLGASGAFSSVISAAVVTLSPEYAHSNHFYAGYVADGNNPLKDWLMFEVLGVLAGGFISGVFAGRVRKKLEKSPTFSSSGRVVLALTGGAMMGFGAKLAGGCTSGMALTQGALLSLGGWAFMLCVFAGAYILAYFLRRQWL